MADYASAFVVVMSHEDDPKIKGKITRNGDGKFANKLSDVPVQFQSLAVQQTDGRWYYAYTRTRYGVDERAHPELRNGGFYSTMGTDAAYDVAKNVFHSYWTFDQVEDQIVATKLLDACVNAGTGNALKVMQTVLTKMGKGLVSWQWGPSMLNFINGCDPVALRATMTSCMIAYYVAVAKKQGFSGLPVTLADGVTTVVAPHAWIARAQWEG